MAERHSQKQGINSELKTLQTKFEQEIKSLQGVLEDEKERYLELEAKLAEKAASLQEREQAWESQEASYRQMIQAAQDQVRLAEATLQTVRKDNENKITQNAREKEGRVEQQANQITELET
jgi:cell division septum initiation protein DivIVA